MTLTLPRNASQPHQEHVLSGNPSWASSCALHWYPQGVTIYWQCFAELPSGTSISQACVTVQHNAHTVPTVSTRSVSDIKDVCGLLCIRWGFTKIGSSAVYMTRPREKWQDQHRKGNKTNVNVMQNPQIMKKGPKWRHISTWKWVEVTVFVLALVTLVLTRMQMLHYQCPFNYMADAMYRQCAFRNISLGCAS